MYDEDAMDDVGSGETHATAEDIFENEERKRREEEEEEERPGYSHGRALLGKE